MLIINDEQGRTILDGTTKVFKFLGSFSIGGVNTPQSGYVDHPMLAQGRPYAFIFPSDGSYLPVGGDPTVDISGSRLTWIYPNADGSVAWKRPPATIVYGVY